MGLWTPQDAKILKTKSVAPLNCPLHKLYVCNVLMMNSSFRTEWASGLPIHFPYLWLLKDPVLKDLWSIRAVPLKSRAEFMFVFIQYRASSGFSSMDRGSQMKASRITEVLLSMAVFHSVFHSSSPNFILFSFKLRVNLKSAFKAVIHCEINGDIQPQINKVYT